MNTRFITKKIVKPSSNRMAMIAAMKKVLSPSSDTIMTAKEAMKPCWNECA